MLLKGYVYDHRTKSNEPIIIDEKILHRTSGEYSGIYPIFNFFLNDNPGFNIVCANGFLYVSPLQDFVPDSKTFRKTVSWEEFCSAWLQTQSNLKSSAQRLLRKA